MSTYQCEQCGQSFQKLSQLLQHRRTENHWQKFTCPNCKKTFTRKDNLDRHMKKHVDENNHHCPECLRVFTRRDALDEHFLQHHDQSGEGKKRKSQDEGNGMIKRLKKDDDPRQFYSIKKVKSQQIRKFKTTAASYKISFKDIEVTENVLMTLKKMFMAIFEDVTIGAKSKDLVRLVVQSPSLDYPIVIPFGRLPTLTTERFMAEIERVLQSNEDFTIDESLILEVTIVDMPDGGSKKRCKYVNTNQFLLDKRCIIQIKNNDELCCARAIVTAKAKIEKHQQWNNIRQGRLLQEKLARDLHEKAGVALRYCGIEEIKQFQRVLQGYQIHVVSKEHFNGIIYKGPEAEKKLYLYYHDQHYDVISSMPAFLCKSYFCTKCQKGYDLKEKHKCNNICHACRKIHDECKEEEWINCDDCYRLFKGTDCFFLHKKLSGTGNSTCLSVYRCKDCGKTVNKKLSKKQHQCGDVYCTVCKDFFQEGHRCYMMPEENNLEEQMSVEEEIINEIENSTTYIFFDFECRQDDMLECEAGYTPDMYGKCQNCLMSNCGVYEHKPNLCVVQKVCTVCADKETECEHCGPREHVFKGESTLEDFCLWLLSEENYNCIVLCHNFQGYDSYPILQYLYKNAVLPTIVPNGAKIMALTVPSCKIKMIDSINFLPMALAKLPAMFGFEELKKGYFPHLYNRKENQNAVLDRLPDLSYYNPDSMKLKDKNDFLKWYNDHKNDRFDLQHELLEYCRSDVDILRRCCMKFQENFMDITGIDPFEKCITIASACNLVFRTNFLSPETIGLIPHKGYNPEHKHSIKALQWLKYISFSENIDIQHAKNGGEKTIGPYRVDGYAEVGGRKVVFEFNGDFWHGNPAKYSKSTINTVNKMTMGELFDKTLEKQHYLESQSYEYRCIWESDFDELIEKDSSVRSFIEDLDITSPLEPRDAFFGGRTEAYTLYKETSEEETIDYYDVTSLYPWVNKTGKIPIGHPLIITENIGQLEDYEGLIKCKVIPPKGLFQPVLPCKCNGKLLFHLCMTCARTQEQAQCSHTDNERSFVGTWVTDEVKKAVEKGYKIKKIYEVWHFEKISQYDPKSKKGGLFTDYVNTFLKLKQEASGWPKWCVTETDRQKYIDLYYQKEGIFLEYQKIKKNPGLRALAKLMLNSFWGKFGQRSNMSQVDLIDDPTDYFDKLTSDQEDVTCVNYVSDDFVEIRWRYKDDFVDTNPKTNVVIAAYTTAQARLKLLSYLEILGQRVLYADTDSIVFSTAKGQTKPELNDFLGDLTDEVPGNSIVTFITGGPKNYGYQLQKPDEDGNLTHCKVRGISLNCKNTLNVNFEVLRTLVTKNQNNSTSVVNAHKITRDRNSTKLLTVCERKDYRLVFDKRVIRNNYISFPYGY